MAAASAACSADRSAGRTTAIDPAAEPGGDKTADGGDGRRSSAAAAASAAAIKSAKIPRRFIEGPAGLRQFVDLNEREAGGGADAGDLRGVSTGGESHDHGGIGATGREGERSGLR